MFSSPLVQRGAGQLRLTETRMQHWMHHDDGTQALPIRTGRTVHGKLHGPLLWAECKLKEASCRKHRPLGP